MLELVNGSADGLRFIPGAQYRNRSDLTPLNDHLYNGTGHYVENDEADPNFSDLQTLFLACFATLVPLILSLVTAFAVRKIWRKYRRNRECRSYDGVLQRDESSDRLSPQTGPPLHVHLLNSDKVKACESQFSITPDEIECSTSPVLYSGSSSRTNHASANGSIITMTLKNNHLIVETEERNDLVEDGRETTMRYSATPQDGVFVVEVQQTVRARDPSPKANASVPAGYGDDEVNDQRALVHNPPPDRYPDEADTLDEVDEHYYPETTSPSNHTSSTTTQLKPSTTNTGLSQSTISLSSDGPITPYTYSNQQGYELGNYGYTIYNGYVHDDDDTITVARAPSHYVAAPGHTKPKITSALYKRNGRAMTMKSIDCDGIGNRMESDVDDAIQEEQMRLGNMPKVAVETPLIFEQFKQSIIAKSVPKFEKLQNDLSPLGVNNTNINEC